MTQQILFFPCGITPFYNLSPIYPRQPPVAALPRNGSTPRGKERVLAAEMSVADRMIERNYENREEERERGRSREKEIGWIRGAKGDEGVDGSTPSTR